MQSTLREVSLPSIRANPHRRIETYPLNQRKLEALKQSIAQVGFWEGVIVRPADNGYECAFGHHRLAAARDQLGKDASIIVVVRDLDDAQMLQFMGRENGEDYNADFLVMLETWEAAIKFLGAKAPKTDKPLKIAQFLGWTRLHTDGGLKMTETAQACNAASQLIADDDNDFSRDDLRGLSVKQAREICQATVAHLDTIDRAAAKQAKLSPETAPTARQVKRVKKIYAGSARSVASDVREGRIGTEKVRGKIWSQADVMVREKGLPDFGIATEQLAKRIEGSYGEEVQGKLKELCDAAYLVPEEDRHRYRHLAFVSDELSRRAASGAERARKAADAPYGSTNLRVLKGA